MDMKARLCTVLMVVGVAMAVGGLLTFGPSRFTVTAGGITGTCSSVFGGPRGDMGNADDGKQRQQLDGLTRGSLWESAQPSFDDLCNAERDSRKTWMWVLVVVGVTLAGGSAFVFWPTRASAK